MFSRRRSGSCGTTLLLLGIIGICAYTIVSSRSSHDDQHTHVTPCPTAATVPPQKCPAVVQSASPAPTTKAKAVTSAATTKTEQRQPFHLTVCVFTYNRLPGLQRIWRSLVEAHYPVGDVVTMKVMYDYKNGERDDTEHWLLTNAVNWPHGPVSVHKREANVGLKHNIMEAYYPLRGDSDEVVAFFEDDIEVSPYWYTWTREALVRYHDQWVNNTQFLGLSLYRPIHDELTSHKMPMHTEHPTTPFLFQQPCSWGAVYLPAAWMRFRQFYTQHRGENPNVKSVWVSSNSWDHKTSWKKYLIKHMIEDGAFMLYANFPSKAVLSTNHLMKGEHPTPPRHLFELPLLTKQIVDEYSSKTGGTYNPLAFPAFSKLPIYNVVVSRVGSLSELHREG
eukprot:PhM_4_TR1961/c0_g1_i1/m.96298